MMNNICRLCLMMNNICRLCLMMNNVCRLCLMMNNVCRLCLMMNNICRLCLMMNSICRFCLMMNNKDYLVNYLIWNFPCCTSFSSICSSTAFSPVQVQHFCSVAADCISHGNPRRVCSSISISSYGNYLTKGFQASRLQGVHWQNARHWHRWPKFNLPTSVGHVNQRTRCRRICG